MPYFLNSNFKNNEFELTFKEKFFVDKTKMIDDLNQLVGTKNRYICITRPRRFGKTTNAVMLASYYSKAADFKQLFDNTDISKCESYEKHLNQHNVIYINFSKLPKANCTYQEFIEHYTTKLKNDLDINFSEIKTAKTDPLFIIFSQIFEKTNQGFIFILDEWDFIFNNKLFSEDERKNFLQFLKDLLKDEPYVEFAYMTGVLPIAKYSSTSALNMFDEYNFLNDSDFDEYFGFTEKEVLTLCNKQKKLSITELKDWYNGYKTCGEHEVYNPRSVISALKRGKCQSYWTNTGPMNEIIYYAGSNMDLVRDDIVKMATGIPLEISLKGYETEQLTLVTRNQLLSGMAVYGFLSYHNNILEIPNKELRMKFCDALEDKSMGELSKVIVKSNEMLKATLRQDTETMVNIIQEVHDLNIPIFKYKDENSLACVVKFAYLSAIDDYNIKREEHAGVGFADFIFYPKDKNKTAFILELKINSTPDKALEQIKKTRYGLELNDYPGKKLAVGISYDKKLKNHKIKIEEIL